MISKMVAGQWLGLLLLPTTFASKGKPTIEVTVFNSTTRWESCTQSFCEPGSVIQWMDIVVNNTGATGWITASDQMTVEVRSDALQTVQPASIKRLMPGDSAVVSVGVQNQDNVTAGSVNPAEAIAIWGNNKQASLSAQATCGIPSYSPSASSVNTHQSPDWFRNAKFGIFIHWGVYSVPAYGNVGPAEGYAEWYWNHQMNKSDPSQTYQYGLETYGPNVVYDDFIANFTADKFVPKDWVDLIADSGAKYFVPTTKHHDGFALFDMPSTITNRNSVNYGPRRDLIKEIFDAAEEYQPQLVRGTYFSLPEWFNPLYTPYGDGYQWGIGPPYNPYTNESVPYTGFVEVDDFVNDIQSPQIEILMNDYNTSIMWCDIGRASHTDQLFSTWLNDARSQGRQVTFNSRCGTTTTGLVVGDYQTPEYKPVNNFTVQHWEGCRGLDPHSFGYNKFTPNDLYMNASAIVNLIVDTTAKNGNFLLDIGPRADGTIPDIMATNLRQAGKWFKAHAESIFDTKYWPKTQGSGNTRYTTTDDAFYIHILEITPGELVVSDKVPYLQGDRVTIVGGTLDGHVVTSGLNSDGLLVLKISQQVVSADKYVWTFKITY